VFHNRCPFTRARPSLGFNSKNPFALRDSPEGPTATAATPPPRETHQSGCQNPVKGVILWNNARDHNL